MNDMPNSNQNEKDVLVVVSKLKNYIKDTSGLNTSGSVATALSEIVRKMCSDAIERAKNDGRKTVMDRDFASMTSSSSSSM
jgi:histone H3/H4